LPETPESGYSSILLDHYRNPRNLGSVDEADAAVLVHESRCGDILRLTARLRDGRIATVRFKASGCAAAVAVGSRLTQLLTGTDVESALALTAERIAGSVGGLPPARAHAADLGRTAVERLVERLRAWGEEGSREAARPG